MRVLEPGRRLAMTLAATLLLTACGGGGDVFSGAETDIGEIDLEAGTYTVFCAIPLHREKGMVGTLTVS